MIEGVKWLKPDDFINKNKCDTKCFVSEFGEVYEAVLRENDRARFYLKDVDLSGINICVSIDKDDIDGVCIREDGQQKPVLR